MKPRLLTSLKINNFLKMWIRHASFSITVTSDIWSFLTLEYWLHFTPLINFGDETKCSLHTICTMYTANFICH